MPGLVGHTSEFVARAGLTLGVVAMATALAAGCASSEPVDVAPAENESAAAAEDAATAAPLPESTVTASEPVPAEEATSPPSLEDGDVIDTERFPTVVDVTAAPAGDNSWRFDVTLSSPYDTPERYADAWRVLDADDNELGIRVLTHDHANEQPFTRSTTVEVPAGLDQVFVEGRDQVNGWSGERFEVDLEP